MRNPGIVVRRWAALGLMTLVTAGAVGCARNPVTGRRELALISESQEIQLGREGAQQVVQQLGLVDDPELQQYVDRIGQRLAADSERPNLPWSFGVVEDPTPNAFALPGGFIFITRGLMNIMNSEAELASVLGHEIGHVTARHSVQQLSQQQLAQLGLGIGAILAPEAAGQFGQLASTGLQLLFLKYGRDDERQADELGFRYALQENYDVREMADVFEQLRRVGGGEGASPLPSWLATHPYPEERIQNVEGYIAALDAGALANVVSDRPQYLQQIDGLAYGENPRNGYFRDGAFIHPELRFRFSLPQGWQTQNLPQAVVGVSPQQDAAIQLTLAQGADPTAAARAFLAQQGVQAGQTFQQNINGIPAAGSYFQAQTQQGVVQGLVAFFSYGGNTYQMLGYAPSGQFPQYDRTIQQVIGSFRPLTDPALINVQVPRLDIVRIDQRMTLAQFAQRYATTLPLDELALINQLPSTDAVLEAGMYVKRVVQ